jgi:hypothetical protein
MVISRPKNLRATVALGLFLIVLLHLTLVNGYAPAQAAQTVDLPVQSVAPGEAALTVNLELPAGCKLNQEAPSTFSLESADINIAAVDEKSAKNLPVANLPLSLTVPVKEGKTTLQAAFRLNFCDEKLGLCFLKEAVLNLPVEVKKSVPNKKLAIVYKPKVD